MVFGWDDEDPDGEPCVPDDVSTAELLADCAAEAARCDAVVAAHRLDDVSARRGFPLRWPLLHLLDLLRELADGSAGEEPTG